MALIRDDYWLKLAGRERSRKDGRAEKLWTVGDSEKVGLRHERNILRERERERKRERERESASQEWEGVELMTMVEWCVSGVNDLRFIGREFDKRGEELRGDRLANLSMEETGGRERHR